MDAADRQQTDERRKKTAESFERALTDPDFRERFLAVPAPAADSGRQSAELPPQAEQKRREILTAVLDRASSDPQFRQQLTTDPRQAFRSGGFTAQLEQLRAEMPQREVQGYTWTWQWEWTDWGWQLGLINTYGTKLWG